MTFGQTTSRQIDSLLLTLATVPADTIRYESLYALANAFKFTDIQKSRAYATQALKLATKLNRPDARAACYTFLGWIFQQEGNRFKARQSTLDALLIWERLSTPEARFRYYIGKGILLQEEHGNTQQALAFYEKATAIAVENRLMHALPEIHNQTGLFYKQHGQFPLARRYFLNAMQEGRKLPADNRDLVSAFYNNMAAVALEDGNSGEVIRWVNQAIEVNQQHNNLFSQTYSFEILGRIYAYEKRPEEATRLFTEALKLTQQLKSVNRQYRLYQLLSESYEQAHQPQVALTYLKLYNKLHDSLLTVQKEQQLVELQVKYRAREQEERLRQLHAENDFFVRRLFYVGSGAGLLLLLLATIGVRYWQLRRKNADMQDQLVQLKLMMKELHHRVKNNLAIVSGLLNLQTYQMRDEKAIGAIRSGQERIEAMSLIHQKLYQTDNQTQVNVQEYLLNLTENLLRSHGYRPDYFDLRFDITVEWLDVNLAIPLGLIANELITNALKYAYHQTERPVLKVSLRTEPTLVLEVADNGPGFDMSSWQGTNGSFGKQLVKALGKQLGAHLRIYFDNGTCVRLSLP